MGYTRHKDAERRIRSAVTIIKALLREELYPAHLREFLSNALWKITEADGKYKTQYRSRAAMTAPRNQLQHEHVFRREKMVDAILAQPDQVDTIVARAVGCLVTKEEHARLHDIVGDVDGWQRYKLAAIEVIDLATGQTI